MKSIRVFIFLVLSISFLIGAYYLLPDLGKEQPRSNHVKASDSHQELDTLALPSISNATFQRLILKRDVQPGDTLGIILKDRYQALRDSLLAFAKTGKSEANFNLLPSPFQKEVNAIVAALKADANASKTQKTKTRFALRGIEREYLNSEIMGAEDASTELIGILSHLEDSGRGNSAAAQKARIQLRKKQEFIASAKKRMAKKITYSSSASSITDAPKLTEAQRARILSLSAELPLDTQRVFAPIAGRYYRPDDGVGYIIGQATSRATSKSNTSLGNSSSGYTLEAQGSPILWGKAQRKEQLDTAESSTRNKLRVFID